MASYIAVYDLKSTVPSPHSRFIEEAEKLGWSRIIWGPTNEKWFLLPNTTFVGDFATRASARKAFDDAVAATTAALKTQTVVEKFFIATYASASFNSDERYDPG